MANVYDVATYILEKKGRLSTMKLQKLCYYSQAWALAWGDEPLFCEDFRAWANGPVCKELFYKTQGQYSVEAADEQGNSSELTAQQIETIDKVLEYYGDKDAQWLSRLTHMEDPWRLARKGMTEGEFGDQIITKESMAIYYGGL